MTIHLLSQLRTHDPVILMRDDGRTQEANFRRLSKEPFGAWFMTDSGEQLVTPGELGMGWWKIERDEILR